MNDFKEFYLSTIGEKENYIIFTSDLYKFSEIDIINMIKICLIDKRSKILGNKFLNVYKNCNINEELINERLKDIGLIKDEPKPTKRRNPKIK